MLGLINFSHSIPLHRAYPKQEELYLDTPKGVLEAILDGNVSCGMVSLVDSFDHDLEIVETAVIRSKKAVMSTLLVSSGKNAAKKMKIAVTRHTRTTLLYLESILKSFGIDYSIIQSEHTEAADLLTEADFALVIGDEALRVFSTQYRIIWDVGFGFNALTGLSPLFAVTARRPDTDCSRELHDLETAVSEASAFRKESERLAVEGFLIPPEIIHRYYDLILYDFGTESRRTLNYVSRMISMGTA